MFNQDREYYRSVFVSAWRKYQNKETLQQLEQHIVGVALMHPEYHAVLENKEQALIKDYTPDGGETNPFMHMALHVTVHEQIATNNPKGIRTLYRQLLKKYKSDEHDIEHMIMECLMEWIWETQVKQQTADIKKYVRCVKKLL